MKLKRIASACISIVILFSLTACRPNRPEPTDLSTLEVRKNDVNFGKYTWTVLEIKDDAALLITNEIVDTCFFKEAYEATDWGGSDIRSYLNDPFLNQNFTAAEQETIVQVMNTTPDNPWFSTSGGGDTLDKIFLLSIEEVVTYFGDSGQLENGNPENEYTIDDEYNDARVARHDGAKSWWWLRSMGHNSKFAAVVTHSGRLDVGGYFVQYAFGIRPAIWVEMY